MIDSNSSVTDGGKGTSSALGFSWCRCVVADWMPSWWGMWRYRPVTSIAARMACGGKVVESKSEASVLESRV